MAKRKKLLRGLDEVEILLPEVSAEEIHRRTTQMRNEQKKYDQARAKEQKDEELDDFIARAKKVGLRYTRAQADFLLDEFGPSRNVPWDGRVG